MRLPPRDSRLTTIVVGGLALFSSGAAWLPSPYGVTIIAVLLLAIVLLLANAFILKIPFFAYDRILSAVSNSDGLEWRREAGVRLDVGGIHGSCQVYYPDVVDLHGGGYRLYYRAGGEDAFIGSAHSTDGLNWREEPGIRVDRGGKYGFNRVESCDVLGLEDGEWRMYFSAFDGDFWSIYRCESGDGLQWGDAVLCVEATKDIDLPNVKAPTVVQTEFGWRMYYMRSSQHRVEIYTSFSADGENWQEGRSCTGICYEGSVARNPHVRRLVGGALQMYFSDRVGPESTALGACIRSARSADGIHWQREPGIRIGPGEYYDRHGVFSVDFLQTSQGLRMYYTGYWGQHWLEPLTLLQYGKSLLI